MACSDPDFRISEEVRDGQIQGCSSDHIFSLVNNANSLGSLCSDSEPLCREHPSFFCLLHFLGSSDSSTSFLCLPTSLAHNSCCVNLRILGLPGASVTTLPIASTTSGYSNLHGGLGWQSNPTVDPNSTGQLPHAHNRIYSNTAQSWLLPDVQRHPNDSPMPAGVSAWQLS